MSPSLLDFLRHIEHECAFLVQLSAGRDRSALLDDPTNSRAIVRSLEVIGEAVKKLPPNLRTKYPQVDWSDIAGMRDVLSTTTSGSTTTSCGRCFSSTSRSCTTS